MNSKMIFTFLEELSENNNREWFHANKSRYEEAKNEFGAFVSLMTGGIAKFDKSIINVSVKDCIFRIYNDVRFAKNKPLYKTNFGASIAKGGKNRGYAGYYLHLEKGSSFIAGGIYLPPPDKLKLIRQEIYYNHKEFCAIFENKNFRKYFNGLDDIRLSRVPKEFPKDAASAEMLRYKSFTVSLPLIQKQIFSDGFAHFALEVFKTIMPLNDFLNRAVYIPEEKQ